MSVPGNETARCSELYNEYDATAAVLAGMYLLFGVVYALYGYRCFKAVMFLTGLTFGSVLVYCVCLEEELLPPAGNIGVSLLAGLLFGLITMLVQYVGLFVTGLHSGLLLGTATLLIMFPWYQPYTIWLNIALFKGLGLLGAISTLFWQKGGTIFGTSLYGGALIALTSDYFIEKLGMAWWVWDRIKLEPSVEKPCWFSWLFIAIWPALTIVGMITQWCFTGRGIYHQQMMPSRRTKQVNLHRIRQEEYKAEQKQRKYRYLYQVRTAHGDVISQNYIQGLQKKVLPPLDDSFTTLHSDFTHLTALNPSESTSTSMSQIQ